MKGKSKHESVVYRAIVKDENSITKTYTGLTSNTFKKLYNRHDSEFF